MVRAFWRNLRGALRRVFPEAPMNAQAVAFNSFMSFFPVLLVVLGVLSSSTLLSTAAQEMIGRLRTILPPGSQRLVVDYLLGHGGKPIRWILIGLGGTLLGGTQVMTNMMQGFRVIYRDRVRPRFWRDQLHGLTLLCLTLVPWMVAVVLTVFGRQVRGWMIVRFGLPGLFNFLWALVYTGLALVLAMLALAVIYRVGLPRAAAVRDWNQVLPGTLLATLLWWAVNSIFGYYVRKVPYSVVYGGLAAAIGLLVWMYFSALVVFIGAAFNAEAVGADQPPAEVPRVVPASQPAGEPAASKLEEVVSEGSEQV